MTLDEVVRECHGHKNYTNEIDRETAEKQSCPQCGQPMEYLGLKQMSYRAFAICAKCNYAEEF